MKKILSVITVIAVLNNCIAQTPPIRIPKTGANKDAVNQGNTQVPIGTIKKDEQKLLPIVQLDAGIVAATESIMAKMKEVVIKANGFKDDKLTEVFNSTKVKGYYRNTNGANGIIYYNTARKKSIFIYGEIRKFYDSQGGSDSYIDYPVNDITNVKSGFDGQYGEYAMFEGACITVNSKRKLQVVFGSIYEKYRTLGAALSNLGFPVSDRVKYTTSSYAQVFDGGMIITNNNAAFSVLGSIFRKYTYADCGLPLDDATSEKANSKVVFTVTTQHFEKNVIVSSTKTSPCFVKNDIYKKWMTYGNSINNSCGLPTSDAVDNGAMTAQNFENGLMLSVNGKVTFVPDDNEKNTQENNKIRQTNKLNTIKFTPVKLQ
jgi:uncharacterized protein with LGFP repeats